MCVLTTHNGFDLQGASDRIGEMWIGGIESFRETKARVPTWGPEIDRDVAKYIRGLEDWVIGNLHWSYMSERYFGKEGLKIKQSRVVRLLEKRIPRNAA